MLRQVLNPSTIGDGAKLLPWLTKVQTNLMLGRTGELTASPNGPAWAEERDDILERANWLCEQVTVPPARLIANAPAVIGEHFACEWAIYSCSMLAHALANIASLYPDKAAQCPGKIAQLIETVNSPEIRAYDTQTWHEDAIAGLGGKKDHMTYVSILAWMISNYRLAGGDNRYDKLYQQLCDHLHRRMLASPYELNLLSFPGKKIWLPDMLVSIVALHNYGRLFDSRYEPTLKQWLTNAKTIWRHRQTGLLASTLPGAGRNARGMQILGSHVALCCSYLSLVDPEFAEEQYALMKQHLLGSTTVMHTTVRGVREWLRQSNVTKLAAGDAGLIVKGLSAGGTAFALGACTAFGDWETRYEFLRTAEIAGCTVKEDHMRHYKMGELFLVGEATALAMRTNIIR